MENHYQIKEKQISMGLVITDKRSTRQELRGMELVVKKVGFSCDCDKVLQKTKHTEMPILTQTMKTTDFYKQSCSI